MYLPTIRVARLAAGVAKGVAGEEGFEPSHAGIKTLCLNQLGDSPVEFPVHGIITDH